MSDYQELVKREARAFYDAARQDFENDGGEFGGKSETPNLFKWIDRTGKLAARVEEISARWTHKDHLWVKTNTRNPAPGGGDVASNAFVSFMQDVRWEIKKLARKSPGGSP